MKPDFEDIASELLKECNRQFSCNGEISGMEIDFKDELEKAFLAGQASCTPIKWPSRSAAHKAMINDAHISNFTDITAFNYAWFKCYEWLKSFVEEGEK